MNSKIKIIKKYWLELALIFLLNTVLLVYSSTISVDTTKYSIINPLLLALPSFFPMISGAIGGFLISKKTNKLSEILFIPIIAIIFSTIIYSIITIIPLFFIPEKDWLNEINLIKQYSGVTISLNEFKINSFLELAAPIIEFVFSSIGSTLIGVIIGKKIKTIMVRFNG